MIMFLYIALFIVAVKGEFTLNVFHHNDIHSYILPAYSSGTTCDPQDIHKCYGGVSRLGALARKFQNEPNFLHVNAGDMYQGTEWYTQFKYAPLIEFTNLLAMHAMAIGNHEFDDGVNGLLPYLANITVPVVAANVDLTGEPELAQYITPSIVLDYNGIKVGIVGYITPATKFLAFPGNVQFLNEEEALIAETERLEKEGVQIFIGLGHSGYYRDMEIAEKVPLLDVIIGGHTHSFLYSGTKKPLDRPHGPYPTVIKQANNRNVIVLQAKAYTKYVGKIRINFDDAGEVISWEGEPILIDTTIAPDPEFDAEVQKWIPRLEDIYTKILGETYVFLDNYYCRSRECNIGNLFTEAILARFATPTEKSWTNVNAALFNGGGLRVSIEQGPIKSKNIVAVHPFKNTITLVTMSGETLKQVMEHSVKYLDIPKNYKPGGFLQMAGMKITYDLCAPGGQRVESISILCSECLVPEYQPLLPKENYTVAIPDYIVRGGDGFNILNSNVVSIRPIGLISNDIVEEYIEKTSPIITGLSDRIQFVNDGTQCEVKEGRVFTVIGTPLHVSSKINMGRSHVNVQY